MNKYLTYEEWFNKYENYEDAYIGYVKSQKEMDRLSLLAYDKQQELDQYKNILEDIDKYIHSFKIEDIGEKTMLILNDILLIKNGLTKDVVRLNKMKELEEDK